MRTDDDDAKKLIVWHLGRGLHHVKRTEGKNKRE